MAKKSYEAAGDSLRVVDEGQTKHGTQIPNYIIDLWLPIIEASGLAVWTILKRMDDLGGSKGKLRINLEKLGRSAGYGRRGLKNILERLQRHKFLKLHYPDGREHALHEETIVELLTPPSEVPRTFQKTARGREALKDVQSLSPMAWMISPNGQVTAGPNGQVTAGERSGSRSPQRSGNRSMERSRNRSMPLRTHRTHGVDQVGSTHTCEFCQEEVCVCADWKAYAKDQRLGNGWLKKNLGKDPLSREMVREWKATRSSETAAAAAVDPTRELLKKIISETRALHVGDSGYEREELIADVRYRAERAGLRVDQRTIEEQIGPAPAPEQAPAAAEFDREKLIKIAKEIFGVWDEAKIRSIGEQKRWDPREIEELVHQVKIEQEKAKRAWEQEQVAKREHAQLSATG